MRFIAGVKSLMLDLFFPPECCGCGVIGVFLCSSCSDALARIPPNCVVCHALAPETGGAPLGRTCKRCRPHSSIFAFISPFSYQQKAMRELVHALKYRRSRDVAQVLADLMSAHLDTMGAAFPENAVLVPVPLHKSRERVRGFNQSLLIARALGEKLGMDVARHTLAKIKKTTPQMELLREERLKNLTGTFAIADASLVKGRTAVLVDDVKTTGATLEEAARVLRAAGAKKIWAVTVAH